MREHVIYDGIKYFIQSSGRYYQCGRKNVRPRLLHRKIWTDHYGEIPEGYVIHHKDHDWRNNDISNLEMIERSKHGKDHMVERLKDPVALKKNKEYLNKAIQEAPKWHRSEDGKEWHKVHAKQSWKKHKKGLIQCVVCQKKVNKFFNNRKDVRYCSDSCRDHDYYKSKLRKGNCLLCNKEFECYKYAKTQYCSRTCSNRHRLSNKYKEKSCTSIHNL